MFFEQEKKQAYYQNLMKFLDHAYEERVIYPPKDDLFSAFSYCPYETVKVVSRSISSTKSGAWSFVFG